MYALVLLKKGATLTAPSHDHEHEAFIGSLIRRNAILLGGTWGAVAGPFVAAYLLRCSSLDEARRLASEDPYCREGCYEPEVVEWKLVGINPKAIDPEKVLTADDL